MLDKRIIVLKYKFPERHSNFSDKFVFFLTSSGDLTLDVIEHDLIIVADELDRVHRTLVLNLQILHED
jgi:hypothetical protein